MADSVVVARPRKWAVPRPVVAGIGPGISMLYLSLLVGLPVAALIGVASHGNLWTAVYHDKHTRDVLIFTVLIAFVVAIINTITGIALAWVLVRDEFPGKRIINALIDLPFALPTIVAGLVLLTLYGPNKSVGVNVAGTRIGVMLALLFVTLPFVTRAVQPVLLSLEKDVEDAAACLGAKPWTIFRRIIFPAIRPAAITGATLAFTRALGEFGSVVLIGAGLPRTQIASQVIFNDVENGAPGAAAVVGLILLAIALLVFMILTLITRRWTRHG